MTKTHDIADRRQLLAALGGAAALVAAPALTCAEILTAAWTQRLIASARAQVGVTRSYDPAYTKLTFPGGDVPREKGVCTDVLVRAYRDAFGVDLQLLVNDDMRGHFSLYPRNWNLSRPDPSIDHRRVLNLRVFLTRRGNSLGPAKLTPEIFEPGDIVTQLLPGNLPHIGIVSDRLGGDGRRQVIHNIGAGAEETDVLALYTLTGRFRLPPAEDG